MVQSDESDAEPNIESLYEQDFAALQAECLRAGRLFEDPEFLPQEVLHTGLPANTICSARNTWKQWLPIVSFLQFI